MPTYVKIIGWCVCTLSATYMIHSMVSIARLKRSLQAMEMFGEYVETEFPLLVIAAVYIVGWLVAVWEYAA